VVDRGGGNALSQHVSSLVEHGRIEVCLRSCPIRAQAVEHLRPARDVRGAFSEQLADLPSDGPREISTGDLTAADPGCGYAAAAFDKAGIVAIQTCGENGLGAASVIQLNDRLQRIVKLDLAPGSDPTTLAVGPSGTTVLVDEYSSTAKGASDWIEVFEGQHLRLVIKRPVDTSQIRSATF